MTIDTPIYEQLVTPYVLEEHDWDIACDSTTHAKGIGGHVVTEEASFLVIAGCCGLSHFMCAGWVAQVRANRLLHCTPGCGSIIPVSEIQFIPLDVS